MRHGSRETWKERRRWRPRHIFAAESKTTQEPEPRGQVSTCFSLLLIIVFRNRLRAGVSRAVHQVTAINEEEEAETVDQAVVLHEAEPPNENADLPPPATVSEQAIVDDPAFDENIAPPSTVDFSGIRVEMLLPLQVLTDSPIPVPARG